MFNFFKLFRKLNFYFLGVVFIFSWTVLFSLPNQVEAGECGGDVVCACGDTVVESYILTDDLVCTGHGLIIGASDITINGNNHTITGDGGNNDYGINDSDGYDNILLENFSDIKNFQYGVNLNNTQSSIIKNNKFSLNNYGINLYGSSSNNILNNIVDDSRLGGIHFNSSSLNNIEGNTITNSTASGIDIMFSSSNNIIDNIFRNNGQSGVLMIVSSSNTISRNSVFNSQYSIFAQNSNNNVITDNIINNSITGFYLLNSSGNTINDNTTFNNVVGIYHNSVNTYSNNKFIQNANDSTLTFSNVDREINLGDTVIFSASMFNVDGTDCLDCSYSVSISPTELITSNIENNDISGSFSVTRYGIYSLVFIVTDSNNNITKKNFLFLVDSSGLKTTKYYLRKLNVTHGQSYGNGTDSKTLILMEPTDTEIWICGVWVQNSIDVLPEYPLSILSGVNTYSSYKTSADGFIGIQRYANYDELVDINSNIPTAESFTWINKNFNDLNLVMDNQRNWYWVTLKLYGSSPQWQTTVNQPAYADFTYHYTTTPAIKSISNEDINVLSATSASIESKDAEIVLENPLTENQTTIITLDDFNRSFLGAINTFNSDQTLNLNIDISADSISTLNTIPLDIIPSSGSVTVSIDTWNTDGDFYKKWTEEGSVHGISTEHVVGNLNPNTDYSVKIDNHVFHNYTANQDGEISFTYDGGYSTKIFEIEKKANSSSGFYIFGFKPDSLITTTKLIETNDSLVATKYIFNRDLRYKMIGEDVKELQKYLNNSGFKLSKSGVGSFDKETNYFGLLTKNALIKFQTANKLKPDGIFGPITRGVVNILK